MTNKNITFANLIAPISEDEFFKKFHDTKFLHIRSENTEKFTNIMSWDILTNMLNMTSVWSPTSLGLYLDTKPIPSDQYCRPAIDRNNNPGLQPDAEKVIAFLRKGASLVANDVDALNPGSAGAANALESRLGGRVQANLYCSWNQHQAFDTHFDSHEVFAMHIAGEKVWRIYEGRLENPIADETTKRLGAEFHHKQRGQVVAEITLKPGDLLYIPRGQYHDALASSEAAMHLTFGLTLIIGYDVLQILFETAMKDPLFRSNIPLPEKGPVSQKKWLKEIAEQLHSITTSDEIFDKLTSYKDNFHYFRGGFDLPGDILEHKSEKRFKVVVRSLKIKKDNGKQLLSSEKGEVVVPNEVATPLKWIINQGNFSLSELVRENPSLDNDSCRKLIENLLKMKAISSV